MKDHTTANKKKGIKKRWITGLIIILTIVAIHLALEPVALYYVNKELDNLEGYKGHVEDIDIHLWRGAYKIRGLNIQKENSGVYEPFFKAPLTDISVEWKALFKGKIVSEIEMTEPILNFAVEPSTGKVQSGGENDWVQTLKGITPLQINRFQVFNGSVHYIDKTTEPAVDISAYSLNGLATNLSNVNESDSLLPSHITVTSKTSGDGELKGEMNINPLKKVPDFDLNLEVNNVELTSLENFTEAYANFKFKEGQLYVSTEIAMKDGQFEGYVKPVLENIKIIDLDNKSTSFWRKTWEVVLGVTMEVFENQKEDRFATRVPFSGDANSTDVGILPTIGNVLRNAFLSAFQKNLGESVNINDVGNKEKKDEGFFDSLFGGDDEEGKEQQ